MITKTMVDHIKDTLNNLTKGKNPNFGKDENAGETAPDGGILVVLTDESNLENFTGYSNILASSTVLDDSKAEVFKINSANNKTIDVNNIPYSETISINSGDANGFAIVQVNQDELQSKDITGSGPNADLRKKYIIKASSADNESVPNYKILFSGTLSSPQKIQDNNSFSLSNIKITFN